MAKNNLLPILVWFRQDLRLKDNPALTYACQTGRPIIPLYILDDENPGTWKMGSASRWWLHHSLISLNQSLQQKGSELFLYKGETLTIILSLIQKYQITAIFWNRCYEPCAIRLEQKLKNLVPSSQSFNGSLLFEPWEILNKQNEPFKIFTPFWNESLKVESIENLLYLNPVTLRQKKLNQSPLIPGLSSLTTPTGPKDCKTVGK